MKLPEIYKNKIENNLKNNKNIFVGDTRDVNILDDIPCEVVIETKNKLFNAKIVGKTNNYLVTSNRNVIKRKDIVSIKKA